MRGPCLGECWLPCGRPPRMNGTLCVQGGDPEKASFPLSMLKGKRDLSKLPDPRMEACPQSETRARTTVDQCSGLRQAGPRMQAWHWCPR